MRSGTLTIFNASAGSGKTWKLTGIYLANLFKSRYNYRKILAVTFTNKATAEMKNRILDNLFFIANGEHSDYLPDLVKTTGKTEQSVRQEAREILHTILHDFSRFSVSTIDSFFQRILRAFAKDAGLHSGFSIEIDHSTILSSAVDEMIESAAGDKQLKNWLTEYAETNIEDSKSWNLKGEILKLAEELFREKFKLLSAEERSKLRDKEFMISYIREMVAISSSFKKQMTDYGKRCAEIYDEYRLSDEMFYQKGRGIPSFIRSWAAGDIKPPNSYLREIENDPPKWAAGSIDNRLQKAISGGLENTLKDALSWYDNNICNYKTANTIRSNIFALGILSDVLHNVHLITTDKNSFLLSDAGEVLYLITGNDQAPFIYEKVGNRYENFMMDEFQDTSIIQWNNFEPLIGNSMASGFDNLVVGDVKQSIYRWRNSDWRILGSMLNRLVDNERFISETLKTNWRSLTNVIKFNNTLFSIIPRRIDEELSGEALPVSFRELFSEAVQIDPGKNNKGYVRLEFIKDNNDTKWDEIALQKLPSVIENFEDKGYNASDIGILVRDNREGANVLRRMIDYRNTCTEARKNIYNYDTVSNDSLLLSQAFVINFIMSVMAVLNDERDMISRARMLRFYLLSTGREDTDNISLISDNLIDESSRFFPDGYKDFIESIKHLPLFELTERVINFFRLGEYAWNVAYLNTFQDYVLNFSGKESSGIQPFIEWWETDGKRKSVVLPEHQNAIRVLTIHKSKGLEFKIVILPFLSWNLDHKAFKPVILWVKPGIPPFNKLGVVPVRYKKELSETIFEDSYKEEKYSAFLDNINLLYVAMTRAKNIIYGFVPDKPGNSGIARVIKDAVSFNSPIPESLDIILNDFFNHDTGLFEFGEIPEEIEDTIENPGLKSVNYSVSEDLESLKLKLHGENYFDSGRNEVKEKINYGRLMHEVFESIIIPDDIPLVIRKMVLEGKISGHESAELEKKVTVMINTPEVMEWFQPGSKVMTETGILLQSGVTRRPDRVILKDDKTIIVDFKFGEENTHYVKQVEQYRNLLTDMGYPNVEAYIWYVDKNEIIFA